MKGELVPFELVLKLKEKGYPQNFGRRKSIFAPSYRYYNSKGLVDGAVDDDGLVAYASAPLIFQVLKWLREEKDIHISTTPYINEDYELKWLYNVIIIKVSNVCTFTEKQGRDFTSSDEAALAGIEYTLDHLI